MASRRQVFLIVGLGLIGGSLAAAIRKRFPTSYVLGISRQGRKIIRARKRRLIHEGFADLRQAFSFLRRHSNLQALQHCVFICTPVDVICKSIREADRYAKSGTIVTDVGSTKSVIVRWTDRLRFRNIRYVGSHPLAGSHLSGLEHAQAGLFQDALVFVTPTRKSNPRAVRDLFRFWQALKTRVVKMPPDAHDRLVSQISHLPHAAAAVLVQVVSEGSIRYGSSGFLDTTRVAQGDPRLWTPIFWTNRANVIRDLLSFERVLRRFRNALNQRSANEVYRLLETACRKRRKAALK